MDETMDKKRPLSDLMRSTMDKIREGTTRVLPVAMPPMTTLDRVVEMMPDLVDKVEKYFDKKEEKEPV